MPDYVYLLEHRLSTDQRNALRVLREVAREAGMLQFLTGDVVRDLTSGHAVRELEVTIHGNALKLKKNIEKAGGKVWGEDEASRTLYLCFPGTVRVDIVSAHSVQYPKPGKPVYHPASIQEDLRRRDFTANAMAISLNDGSFGLLMDPLNGAADIEARTLRLVSNYGFIEEPALLIRSTRYRAQLGWDLDPKSQTRYENAKGDGAIESLSEHAIGEELEQIAHEEDGLRVLEAFEAEGWMNVLYPAWTSAKADREGLKALHEQAVELLMQGVHPDMSAAQMQLLTAKLSPKDLSALKKLLIRPGFVEEWNSLDSLAAGFAKTLLAKSNQTPSTTFKLFRSYDPEAILWLGFTTKDAAVKDRYNLFLKVWPEARQRTPHALMQEMRITPELPAYNQIVESIFLELIDGKLTTPEEMRAFLEPHSPPAPPPQVTIKRPRAKRGEAKFKETAVDEDDEEAEEGLEDEELEEIETDDEEIDLGIPIPKGDLDPDDEAEPENSDDDEDSDDEPDSKPAPASKRGGKKAEAPKQAKAAPAPAARAQAPAKPEKAQAKPAAPVAAQKTVAKPEPAASRPVPAKTSSASAPARPVAPVTSKPAISKAIPKPVAKAGPNPPAKAAVKPATKPQPKPAAKPAPAKQVKAAVQAKPKPSKPAAKKPAPKPSKKR